MGDASLGYLVALLVVACICGGIGVWFGDQRNRPVAGFWLGFFFGPFGWLLTLLLPADNSGRATTSEAGRTVPGRTGFGQCPTCGGALVGQYPKCPHCATEVFWVGRAPMRTAQEAADETARQERLAAERQEQRRLAAQRQRQLEQEREAQKREALRRWSERSRAVFLAIVSAARFLLRVTDRVLANLARHRRIVRVRQIALSIRRWLRKTDWLLRRWMDQLRNLDEAGKGRCLQLLLAIMLTAVAISGAVAVIAAIGSYQESWEREQLAWQRRHDKLADRNTRLAVLGFGEHDWDGEVAAMSKGIQEVHLGVNESNEAEVYAGRGLARCATGQWDAAIADLTEAMRLDQIAPRAHHALDPKGADVYCYRGFAHCAKAEWEAAVADLTEAIRLDPRDYRAYAFRSFAYAHQGNTKKSEEDRQSAKRLGFMPAEFARLAEVLE